MGYSDPQPRQTIEERYLSQYDLAEHFGALENRKRTLTADRLHRLPNPVPGQTLLDVGCGDGQFAALAREHGWEPFGVELNPPAAQRARGRGIDVRGGRVEDADLTASSFDVVTAWDVIEHVPDPRLFIEHLARLVAPGGLVVVTTLNRRSLVARTFRSRWSMVVDDHFTYWDARSLEQAFAPTGMSTIRATSFGLGRDFVSWIDRWSRGPSHRASLEVDTGHSSPQSRGWDTQPAVLASEKWVNRFLATTWLGVGIEFAFQAPDNVRSSALRPAPPRADRP